jgi:hypothetical protein
MASKVSKFNWLLLLAVSTVCGCSGEKVKTVPVSGHITLAGQGLPQECYVYFMPTTSEGGTPMRPSMATMESDGSYRVKAFKDSRGLMPGKYSVVVSYFVPNPGGKNLVERRYQAGEFVVEANSGSVEHNIEIPAQASPAKS